MNAVTPVQKKEDNSNGIKNAARAVINDRTGLFVAIFAMGLGFLSTGLWIATAIFGPQLVQAKIDAGVAKAEANAASAAAISDVWRNRVNKLEAELNADRRR